MSDLISRADALALFYPDTQYWGDDIDNKLLSLPSADAESDDLIIKGAKGIQDGLYNIKGGKLFKYKAKGGTVRTYPIVPSADAVDCTDFIEWLVDRMLDDEDWELNAVAYGEIICRKLVKLGVLEATEEPSYYVRPSAEAVDVYKAHEEEHLNIANRIKELQYAIAKTQTIVGKMVESAEAVKIHEDGTLEVKVPNAQKVGRVLVMDSDSHIGGGLFYPDDAEQGKWIPIEEKLPTYDGGEKIWLTGMKCSYCGKLFDLRVGYYFCPNCGARMYKGGGE